MIYRFLLITLFAFAPTILVGQVDSLYIKGQIKNLNGQLYRQTSSVSFFRSNLFDPRSEMVSQAPLQADGSFSIALPLNFDQEEMYLEYGSLATSPFLGSKGTLTLTFDADSIGKAKRLFYFSGVHAAANNQYQLYMPVEAQSFEKNPSVGSDFFKNFWPKSQQQAKALLEQRLQLRLQTLEQYSRNNILDSELKNWLTSKAQAEYANIWMDYLRINDLDIEGEKLDQPSLNLPPLTAEKVTLAEKYGVYADIVKDYYIYRYPTKSAPLPVKAMAGLIHQYNTDLSSQEATKLKQIMEIGITDRAEYDFLNALFLRNKEMINTLFEYEQAKRLYMELLPSSMTDLLSGNYMIKRLNGYTLDQKNLLFRHILSDLKSPALKNSLSEVMQREVKDSVDIRKMVNYQTQQIKPTEVIPGIWVSASNEAGNSWFKELLGQYKGKTIYVIKWNLTDPKSLDELAYLNFLREKAPVGTVFLMVHMDDIEQAASQSGLARQYVVRHQLKGTHMFVASDQLLSLLLRLNPLEPGTYAIIKPNGKYYSKNAPAPSDTERLIPMLIDASR
ncbi:hypothetical protein [Dyadobacter tibetensis]|uniref:hypothetical protein n=1 Tax=Dyadobacter tibetensis TaxID=1211851 RepID=UPI00046F7678|nr:hypothetical protein [Dyadobacter tibetensis]